MVFVLNPTYQKDGRNTEECEAQLTEQQCQITGWKQVDIHRHRSVNVS